MRSNNRCKRSVYPENWSRSWSSTLLLQIAQRKQRYCCLQLQTRPAQSHIRIRSSSDLRGHGQNKNQRLYSVNNCTSLNGSLSSVVAVRNNIQSPCHQAPPIKELNGISSGIKIYECISHVFTLTLYYRSPEHSPSFLLTGSCCDGSSSVTICSNVFTSTYFDNLTRKILSLQVNRKDYNS